MNEQFEDARQEAEQHIVAAEGHGKKGWHTLERDDYLAAAHKFVEAAQAVAPSYPYVLMYARAGQACLSAGEYRIAVNYLNIALDAYPTLDFVTRAEWAGHLTRAVMLLYMEDSLDEG